MYSKLGDGRWAEPAVAPVGPISERKDGACSSPVHLPPGINLRRSSSARACRRDGHHLYFTHPRHGNGAGAPPMDYRQLIGRLHGVLNGLGNVYRVSMTAVRSKP